MLQLRQRICIYLSFCRFIILQFVFYHTRSLPFQPTSIWLHILLALETYVLSFAVELSHPVGTRRMNPMCCLVVLLLLLSYSSASNKRRTFLFLLRM